MSPPEEQPGLHPRALKTTPLNRAALTGSAAKVQSFLVLLNRHRFLVALLAAAATERVEAANAHPALGFWPQVQGYSAVRKRKSARGIANAGRGAGFPSTVFPSPVPCGGFFCFSFDHRTVHEHSGSSDLPFLPCRFRLAHIGVCSGVLAPAFLLPRSIRCAIVRRKLIEEVEGTSVGSLGFVITVMSVSRSISTFSVLVGPVETRGFRRD